MFEGFTQVVNLGIGGMAVVLFYRILTLHLTAVTLALNELTRVVRALDEHLKR